MIDTKKQRLIFILATVSLGISSIIFIPFGSTKFTHVEALIKFIFCPVIIAILNIIITSKKFLDYRPTDRFTSFASYVPVFGYFLALVVNIVFLMTRANPIAVYTYQQFVNVMITFGVVAIGMLLCLCLFDRLAIRLTKFSVALIDTIVIVAFLINTFSFHFKIAKVYETVSLVNHTRWHSFALVVLGILFFVAIFLRMRSLYLGKAEFTSQDKEELLEKWQSKRDTEYFQAELTLLYSLLNYSADRLSIDLYGEDEKKIAKHASAKVNQLTTKVSELQSQLSKIKEREAVEQARNHKMSLAYAELKNQVKIEVATTELEAVKKELEILSHNLEKHYTDYQADLVLYEEEKNELEAKLSALEKEREEVILKLKPVEEEKPVEVIETRGEEKKEKIFVFPYDALIAYAQNLSHAELSVVVNPKGTQHKFMVGNKPYLITQKTSSDYRVTFLAEDTKLLDYLQGYPGLISVANTPKGGNWLKLVNKGELEEGFIKKLVDESLVAELAFEKAKEDAKEAARLAKEEAKAEELRRKEEEKANREKLKMAEKILADNEKEAARQAKEAEKARKEAEKEAIRLAKEAEREAQEEAARLAKEAELQAKEAELLAKEAELQATAEEEEAKRKAEMEAAEQAKKEAEEHAERVRREAELAAEKAKKEAEEHAEKTRREAELAAEKARKEAEKEAAQKAKEAERAKREAEREAARKAKEAEKIVKEAEKEVARKAKEAVAAEKARREAEAEAERILEEAKKKAEMEQSNLGENSSTLVEEPKTGKQSTSRRTTGTKTASTTKTTAKKSPTSTSRTASTRNKKTVDEDKAA